MPSRSRSHFFAIAAAATRTAVSRALLRRNDKPHAEWATRMMFAHDNAVENLVIFAPLVLILNAIDYSSKWTVLACAVYFWARLAHLIVYAMGIPVFRTLAFTVGFLAQAVLALAIFKVL